MFVRNIWFIAVRGELRTCHKNSLQFKFVNNFNKKLHFKICYGVLYLSRVFFRFAFLVDHFLLLTFLNINGMSSVKSVWQQWYHNNICHVAWMFRLTLGRSFHFFLVLLLLALNIICFYIYWSSCKISPMGCSLEIFVYRLLWRCHF